MPNKIAPIKLASYKNYLAPRNREAHKGLFGHALIIGGDYGMAGAVHLAGQAALRVGAGLVSIATHPKHAAAITSHCPEIMCHGTKSGKDLKLLLAKATVIVLGPGLGQSNWSKQLFKAAVNSSLPKIIDADGLNLLAKHPSKNDNWILTPHPGEAARLLNCTLQELQAVRTTSAKTLQQNYGGVVALKGAGTLVASTNNLSICNAGNPGMASGGMGDVLSGVIAGLVAQRIPIAPATELGVYLHALAGDLAAQHGERGMLASDLMPYLRQLVNSV